jgi:aspartate beta-hydroxylase
MTNEQHQAREDYRGKARLGLRQGDQTLAEQSYERLLESDPDDLEALQQLASINLARGGTTEAISLLTRAHRAHPSEPFTLHQLGVVRAAAGDMRGAIEDLRRGLELKPDMFLARLRLGALLDDQGETYEALAATFNAINTAQAKGRWLNDETTAPELRDSVKRATQFVLSGRRKLFNDILEPLRQRYGASELVRVEQCLAMYLGEQKATLPDSRQQPKFLYFPGVPSQPYYPRERFPWQAELEANTAAIRDELLSVLAQPQDLESFLQIDSPQDAADLLKSSGAQQPAWDAYFFHRHGERYDAHAASCPRTAALLDALPLAYVREHSPETLFSVLRPGTHILPHRGVTNTRLVTHLPLIVPNDCALRVGGEVHEWKEGRCVTFDDTYLHEAWNNSDETRVVLILDTWNPDLSEAERAAVADLVGAIGDFNRASEVPVPKG